MLPKGFRTDPTRFLGAITISVEQRGSAVIIPTRSLLVSPPSSPAETLRSIGEHFYGESIEHIWIVGADEEDKWQIEAEIGQYSFGYSLLQTKPKTRQIV